MFKTLLGRTKRETAPMLRLRNKQFCIQQAHLDGWERCRLTMMAKLEEMIAAGRMIEAVENSVHQVEFEGCNPTLRELNEYQDGGWRNSNEAMIRSWRS